MIAVALFILVAVSSGQAPTKAVEIIPQARPVAVWLKAVKDGNQEQLKSVFSETMRRKFDDEGWDKVMSVYQELFRKEFGEYRDEDFSFQFKGDENMGTVSIVYRGKTLPGLQVIRENNEWKVDER